LQFRTHQASGMKISGLAGLYCHFLGLAHPWMTEDGIAGWRKLWKAIPLLFAEFRRS
jgi:hypothetical protein